MSDILVSALAGVAAFFIATQVKKQKEKKEPVKVYKDIARLDVDTDVREQQLLKGYQVAKEPISSRSYKERLGKQDGGM